MATRTIVCLALAVVFFSIYFLQARQPDLLVECPENACEIMVKKGLWEKQTFIVFIDTVGKSFFSEDDWKIFVFLQTVLARAVPSPCRLNLMYIMRPSHSFCCIWLIAVLLKTAVAGHLLVHFCSCVTGLP